MADAFAFNDAAWCLAELGHPHRLQVFNLLVKAGQTGLPVGELGQDRKLGTSSTAL